MTLQILETQLFGIGLPTRDEYVAQLVEAGFVDVEFEDVTSAWRGLTVARSAIPPFATSCASMVNLQLSITSSVRVFNTLLLPSVCGLCLRQRTRPRSGLARAGPA